MLVTELQSHILLIQLSCMRSTYTSTPYTKIYLSFLLSQILCVYVCGLQTEHLSITLLSG